MNSQRSEVRSNDGTEVAVWTSGHGQPLLIVHGAAGTHESWEMMREHLDAYFAVSIMDRRATSGDPWSPLDLRREFEDVAAVARSLGEDLAVLGHSSGALCALGAAPLIPNLRHLLLYEPPLERGAHYPIALQKLQQLLKQGDIDGVYDAWLKDYVRIPASVADQIKTSPVGASMRPLAQYLPREMASHLAWTFDSGAYSSVSADTVYLVGSATPEENAELRGFIKLLEQTLPNFTVREIPGQGHFANFFAPALLSAILRETATRRTGTH
jgi:pimeloyl-ACP methyl ester carboxylesterase